MRFTIRPGKHSANTTVADPPMSQAQTLPSPPSREPGRMPGLVLTGVYSLLLVLLVVFTHQYWLAPDRGRHNVISLQSAVQAQQQTNARLEQRNDNLAQIVARLKLDNEALEEHARYDLGMIRRGETFVRLLEPEKP